MRTLEPAYGLPTFRLFVRKLGKTLNEAAGQISSLTYKRDQLAAALERQKPQKRLKVRAIAQKQFVAIQDIKRVKREIGILPNKLELDSDGEGWVDQSDLEEESDSSVEECIIVS